MWSYKKEFVDWKKGESRQGDTDVGIRRASMRKLWYELRKHGNQKRDEQLGDNCNVDRMGWFVASVS